MSQQASTYDQSLVGLLALQVGDVERAKGIYAFLKKEWDQGPTRKGPREGVLGLVNFYNAEFGSRGIEDIIHAGPNAWAALFAARLAEKEKDRKAFAWALSVAAWMAQTIPHQNGAIAMGPHYALDRQHWSSVYSAENNVSYLGLLSELMRSSQLPAKDRDWIQKEKNGIEQWLLNSAFDRKTYAMNRGVDSHGIDSVHALDSVTWLISALGPEHLAAAGIDPDSLMKKAQSLFEVSVGGITGVDPTDQSEADALSREPLNTNGFAARPTEDNHRMIWFEGLGEYIVALKLMAKYAKGKNQTEMAESYRIHADKLELEFDRGALSAYSDLAAYPYATAGQFFRDGWRAPRDGVKGPASSLVSATYRAFLELGIDPLSGDSLNEEPAVQISLSDIKNAPHESPELLYGSSESMLTKAWEDLDRGQYDLALRQAQATIGEWAPVAKEVQAQKMQDIGHLIAYDRTPETEKQILSYGALNDVGAATFIVGKLFDQEGHFEAAAHAFAELTVNYSLAQVWNNQRWFFWSPLDALRTDYVIRDPAHYGQLLATVTTLAKARL